MNNSLKKLNITLCSSVYAIISLLYFLKHEINNNKLLGIVYRVFIGPERKNLEKHEFSRH